MGAFISAVIVSDGELGFNQSWAFSGLKMIGMRSCKFASILLAEVVIIVNVSNISFSEASHLSQSPANRSGVLSVEEM